MYAVDSMLDACENNLRCRASPPSFTSSWPTPRRSPSITAPTVVADRFSVPPTNLPAS
ncbi:MAG: hypothetical protein MZV70_39720 [Desulfobacterales bacterium]|nr:hypothetical protein [Desulfobacterales bacterium]